MKRDTYNKALLASYRPATDEDPELVQLIISIFNRFHGTRGTRAIRIVLRNEYGRRISRERIKSIMNRNQLFCTSTFAKPKSNNKYAREKLDEGTVVGDKINKRFRSNVIGKHLFIDISYFKTTTGVTVYLAALVDGFNREIKAFRIATNQKVSLVMDVIKDAYANGSIIPEVSILHSDQGPQFKAKIFQQLLKELKITQSMSPAHHCTHNGLMEGIFGVIKNEMKCLPNYCMDTVNDVIKSLCNFIDFFNHIRITSYTGGFTPVYYRLRETGKINLTCCVD